jgi:hypothetical protein
MTETNMSGQELIEAAIRSFGLDPAENKVPDQDKWKLTRGSASLVVRIFNFEGESGIEACSGIMPIPEDANTRLRLFERVMALNDALVGAWFSEREGDLYLIYARRFTGLDEIEIVEMIDRVSAYADKYDDILREEFAGG